MQILGLTQMHWEFTLPIGLSEERQKFMKFYGFSWRLFSKAVTRINNTVLLKQDSAFETDHEQNTNLQKYSTYVSAYLQQTT